MTGGLRNAWASLLASLSVEDQAPPPAPLPPGPPEQQSFVVFDLETTGLHPSQGDAILQIGAVRIEAGAESAAFDSFANPLRPIPAASTRYHGITDAMVAEAPTVPQALAAFRDFAAGAVLVAHNAAFDLTALRAAARDGAPRLDNPAMCSMMLAHWLDPREPDVTLDGLCGRRGIVIAGRHRALGDARATAALWMQLLARASARGVADLADLAARSRMAERIARQAQHF